MKGLEFDDKLISAFSDHPELSILPNGPNPSNLIQSCGMSLELDSSGLSSELDSPQDVILQYISEILMEEEDLEREPFMLQNTLDLQAAEKSFYDVLRQDYLPSPNNQHPSSVPYQNAENPNANFTETCCGNSSSSVQNLIESYRYCDPDSENFESALIQQSSNFDSLLQSFGGASNSFSDAVEDGPLASLVTPLLQVPEDSCSDSLFVSQFLQYDGHCDHGEEPSEQTLQVVVEDERNRMINHSLNKGLRGQKNHRPENSSDYVEGGRSNKQLASSAEDSDLESEMYDEVLLPCLQESVLCYDNDTLHDGATGKAHRRPSGKRQSGKVIDLTSLLTQSAQAIASSDFSLVTELLKRIRRHSSPYGNDSERLAHFFANALEARLAGAGTMLFSPYVSDGVTAADLLKCYQVYIQACPFRVLSNVYANRLILKLSRKAMRLRIVHFGILYGFQWPCLIQHLSARPGGPPLLRITGIELPQPGFRPAERVEETGRRLAKYCERFNVPFEYHAIAKEWHTIQSEDLKINKDELLVVNSLYRFINVADDVPDDSVGVMSSPRDTVLNLIRRINPDLFIHGVLNGTFGAPFFVTRFREALLHYSALFNMYEDTVPREADERMLMEREIWGRDIMNVIACEGTQRVERPETYRQWQARNVKAGFSQLPLDREAVEEVRAKVKIGYNKEFVVDEDSNWMLQGWKGRIIYAISCWKPAEEFE